MSKSETDMKQALVLCMNAMLEGAVENCSVKSRQEAIDAAASTLFYFGVGTAGSGNEHTAIKKVTDTFNNIKDSYIGAVNAGQFKASSNGYRRNN